MKTDDNTSLACIAIPGGIIACRDNKKVVFECILFSAVYANQALFSCKPDADGSSSGFFATEQSNEDREQQSVFKDKLLRQQQPSEPDFIEAY